MKYGSNRAFLGLGLVALLVFTGCGGSAPASTDGGSSTSTAAVATSYGSGALQVTSFAPAAGTYAAMPGQIQVTFNEANLNPYTISSSYWSMTCGTYNYYPSSATLSSTNSAVVVLEFPNVQQLTTSQLPIGSTCTLNISASVSDTNNNTLGVVVTSAYTTASGAAAVPGIVYTPQSNITYIQPTYYIGGPGGSSFTEQAPVPGYTIQGFQIMAGTTVNLLQAVWAPSYGSAVTGPPTLNGATHGGSGGTPSYQMCPTTGNSRVVGIYGYAGYYSGQYVDEIGAICQAQDGSSSTPYYTGAAGTPDGGAFYSLTCPAGTFVTSYSGNSGSLLDAINWIGCQ